MPLKAILKHNTDILPVHHSKIQIAHKTNKIKTTKTIVNELF